MQECILIITLHNWHRKLQLSCDTHHKIMTCTKIDNIIIMRVYTHEHITCTLLRSSSDTIMSSTPETNLGYVFRNTCTVIQALAGIHTVRSYIHIQADRHTHTYMWKSSFICHNIIFITYLSNHHLQSLRSSLPVTTGYVYRMFTLETRSRGQPS